jgi:pyruvate,water dikinase
LLNLTVADKVSRVGSKAFNLGQLTKRGLPTPGGFVVPDGVFQQHLERADVNSAIDALLERLDGLSEQAIASAGAAIRERIIATDLAGPLRAALADVGGRQWRDRPLAVRSSAVGEDSATTSFAGQLDSFLNVAGEPALETALRATWASLFSQRVLLYARHHQLRPRHMGVIVQPQVNARFSGVLFTRDPCGGGHADTMLLEYCAGLGEAVVGGRVTPSRLRIDRGDLTLTPEHGAGDADALDSAAEHAIRQISRWALELEAAEGAPQDLEWCVDAGGLPVIVQARPATQRVAAPPGGRVHWSNANIAENFPEPVSPFLFSIVKPGYSAYFRNLGRGFGVSRRRLAAVATPLDDIVGLQGGHLYYNLTHIHALLQMMPGGRRLVEYFNLFVGAEAIPAPPPLPLGILARAAETLRIAVCVLWQYVFIARRVRRFEAKVHCRAE